MHPPHEQHNAAPCERIIGNAAIRTNNTTTQSTEHGHLQTETLELKAKHASKRANHTNTREEKREGGASANTSLGLYCLRCTTYGSGTPEGWEAACGPQRLA